MDSNNYIELERVGNIEVTDKFNKNNKAAIKAFSKTYTFSIVWVYQSALIRDIHDNVVGIRFNRIENKG